MHKNLRNHSPDEIVTRFLDAENSRGRMKNTALCLFFALYNSKGQYS